MVVKLLKERTLKSMVNHSEDLMLKAQGEILASQD